MVVCLNIYNYKTCLYESDKISILSMIHVNHWPPFLLLKTFAWKLRSPSSYRFFRLKFYAQTTDSTFRICKNHVMPGEKSEWFYQLKAPYILNFWLAYLYEEGNLSMLMYEEFNKDNSDIILFFLRDPGYCWFEWWYMCMCNSIYICSIIFLFHRIIRDLFDMKPLHIYIA